jgi:2-hydroxyacyl-CoA lyase 1
LLKAYFAIFLSDLPKTTQTNRNIAYIRMDGPTFIAKCFKNFGIEVIFGIVGIPITNTVAAAQKEKIKFIGMRNEQAAGYAAGAYGYMTQKPGICMTVAGPGMLNVISGMFNAQSNCWPLIVISAGSEGSEGTVRGSEEMGEGVGTFQQAPQMPVAAPVTKWSAKIPSLSELPRALSLAFRHATYGRPGPVYIEIPSHLFGEKVPENIHIPQGVPKPPLTEAYSEDLNQAIKLLSEAHKPLVVFGKGAAYSQAEIEANELIELTHFPVLTSPMGKGVISDDHKNAVNAARSLALKSADVILLVGARLNWMFHFGQGPRINPNAKIIQVEILPEQCHVNRNADVTLVGDCKIILRQLISSWKPSSFTNDSEWWKSLRQNVETNQANLEKKCKEETVPLGYHFTLKQIADGIPDNAILVSEGANTLDIGRVIIKSTKPRSRLDSSTTAAMGMALGFTIAASTVAPDRKIVAVVGDSAFGFSGMEVEVLCRYNLPVTIFLLNNNGIYSGIEEIEDVNNIPATGFVPKAHYEKVIEAFGGKGYCVETPDELRKVIPEAINSKVPTLVNIFINPRGPIPQNVQQNNQNQK